MRAGLHRHTRAEGSCSERPVLGSTASESPVSMHFQLRPGGSFEHPQSSVPCGASTMLRQEAAGEVSGQRQQVGGGVGVGGARGSKPSLGHRPGLPSLTRHRRRREPASSAAAQLPVIPPRATAAWLKNCLPRQTITCGAWQAAGSWRISTHDTPLAVAGMCAGAGRQGPRVTRFTRYAKSAARKNGALSASHARISALASGEAQPSLSAKAS